LIIGVRRSSGHGPDGSSSACRRPTVPRLGAMRARTLAVALLTALAPQLERALHVPHVSLGATGAVAVDLATGQTLYARNQTLSLLPASNEKLAVTYAVL